MMTGATTTIATMTTTGIGIDPATLTEQLMKSAIARNTLLASATLFCADFRLASIPSQLFPFSLGEKVPRRGG